MSVQNRVLNRIKRRGRGAVFTPKDFLDLGSRAAVDQSLSRMTRDGAIRRLGRGIYDFPKRHPRLGPLTPSADSIARAAVGGKCAVQPSGARAANALGLSTQVPAQTVYYTDGPQRDLRIGDRVIQIRRRSPKNLVGAGTEAGNLYQALRYLGRNRVDDDVIHTLRGRVAPDVRDKLHNDLITHSHLAPDWIVSVSKRLVSETVA